MLMCGSDNFVGNGLFAYLTSKHVPIQTFQFEDMLHQSSLCQHQTMVFNIIDNEQPCSTIVQFLNKNRFKFYNNVVVTEREQQILNLLVNGYTAREISELVSLNYKTIQAHKMRVVTKLGLTNTSELNKLIVRFTHRMSFLP